METAKKLAWVGLGLLIAYSAFIVWYSVQVHKQNVTLIGNQAVEFKDAEGKSYFVSVKQLVTEHTNYLNGGVATGLLPSAENIQDKMK